MQPQLSDEEIKTFFNASIRKSQMWWLLFGLVLPVVILTLASWTRWKSAIHLLAILYFILLALGGIHILTKLYLVRQALKNRFLSTIDADGCLISISHSAIAMILPRERGGGFRVVSHKHIFGWKIENNVLTVEPRSYASFDPSPLESVYFKIPPSLSVLQKDAIHIGITEIYNSIPKSDISWKKYIRRQAIIWAVVILLVVGFIFLKNK